MSLLRRLQDRLRGGSPPSGRTGLDTEWIVRLTGTRPNNVAIYSEALRHRSALHSGQPEDFSNERLEFLGDAVLGMIVAAELLARYPDADEGFLTKLRAKLVNGKTLASCARLIRLGTHVELSENMDRTSGRENRSILSDTYEALIGAIYLDQGLDASRRFVERTLLRVVDIDELAQTRDNYKSMLLELSQAQAWPQPAYRVLEEVGPDHDKIFTVQVLIADRRLGTGTASNKKSAEQKAARVAFEHLSRELSSD